MQKKILRTFAISVVFIGALGPIGVKNAYGIYAEALEYEVTKNHCSQLMCRSKCRGYYQPSPGPVIHEVEVGRSKTGYYSTTHYQTKTVMVSPPLINLGYDCENCGRDLGKEMSRIEPEIVVKRTENKKVVTILESIGKKNRSLCGKPELTGELQEIWKRAREQNSYDMLKSFESGLTQLWNAARYLDDEALKDADGFSNGSEELIPFRVSEYVVETESSCCML